MEIVSKINWVDVLIVILMLRMSYVAFKDGLSHEIFPFIGSIIVLVLSMHYYPKIGLFLSQNLGNMPVEITNFIAFLVLVVALGFLVKLLKAILDKIAKVQWHPVIERFGGLIIGISKAYIITALILTVLALTPLPYLQWSIRDRSLTGKYVLSTGPEIYSRLSFLLPAEGIQGVSAGKDAMLKSLMSDKSISPKKLDNAQKKKPAQSQ